MSTIDNIIATFDPEHVALMERVIQAADELWDFAYRLGGDSDELDSWGDAIVTLERYRRERGLL